MTITDRPPVVPCRGACAGRWCDACRGTATRAGVTACRAALERAALVLDGPRAGDRPYDLTSHTPGADSAGVTSTYNERLQALANQKAEEQ